METIGFLALGLAIGSFGTLVGIGGGIFLVPIFLLVLGWGPQQAVGTSLMVVFLNALSGTLAYVKQKRIYYQAALWFSAATFPGAVAGSSLVRYFSGNGFKLAFGSLLAVLGVWMFIRSTLAKPKEDQLSTNFAYNRTLGIVISAIVGFLSSILGIGGGVIHVPAMIYVLGFPPHIATATSHFVLAISTLFGVVSHILWHNVVMEAAIPLGIGAVIGAQFGARWSSKVKSKGITLLLAFSLFALGARLVVVAWLGGQ